MTMRVIVAVFAVLLHTVHGFQLTIAHTNDVHARFDQSTKYGGVCAVDATNCYGGMARRATIIKELRANRTNMLLLDGGDQFQGTFWFNVYQGQATFYFNQMLGYDAMAIGNHEFDLGMDVLRDYIVNMTHNGTTKIVNSNIDRTHEPRLASVKRWVIHNVNGRKIGIVGYTTRDTPTLVKKGNVGNVIFEDEVESLRMAIGEIKANDSSVNIFIAVGHSGFGIDQRVAAEVADIDIVVGGHTNTFLYSPVDAAPSNNIPDGLYPTVVNKLQGDKKALVVQAFTTGKYMGDLQVTFDEDGEILSQSGNPILLDDSIAKDEIVETELAKYRATVLEIGERPIGKSSVFLSGSCRLVECNFGNFIADSYVAKATSNNHDTAAWSAASIALVNGGSIRTNIEQGNITYAGLLVVLPFMNTLVTVTLKGSVLKEVFENSVSEYSLEERKGRFLQVSGVKVVYNLCNPVGQRVVSLKLRCSKCAVPQLDEYEPEEEYTVITSSFLTTGGDGYSMIEEKHTNRMEFDFVESEVVEEYIKQRPVVYPGLEERITFEEYFPCKPSSASTVNISYLLIATLTVGSYFHF